jgi:hypothetical protein
MKHAITLLLLMSVNVYARDAAIELRDKEFAARSRDMGVVLLHVNWGRHWNCHGYENAQLQKLIFQSVPVKANSDSIELSIPSWLLSKNTFQRYAFLVPPGQYALSGFRFKLAASVSDLRIYEPDASTLIADGMGKAGSFQIAAGEIVYIGHFGVDCNGEPTPWRFYIDDAEDFAKYGEEFHREFPSTASVAVKYRLFETDTFGQPHTLNTTEAEGTQPNNALEPTR